MAKAPANHPTPRRVIPINVFDAHHAPDPALIDACVHCGFCLATCPTYVLWGEEMDSPRGRIYLMKMANEGQAPLNDVTVGHFDACLGCMACVTACPSGVQYDKLIEATRSQVERRYQRHGSDVLFRKMIFALFPKPGRLRAIAGPLAFYQRSGMQRLARASVLKVMPKRLRAMEGLLPTIRRASLRARIPTTTPAQGATRGRVGLVLGCVQRVFFGDVNAATARVLAAEGFEVVTPREQGCCGALMVHAGQERDALAYARRMIDTFEQANVDLIAINAAGCGSTFKEYGHLLRDDPRYAERARAFAAKCRDISEILADITPQAPRHPLPLTIAYHDACHLQHAQGIRAEPRKVLRTIPELRIKEIADAAICCGSAGIYNLVEPVAAQELRDRKVANVLKTGAAAIVSSNPGCLIQILSGLEAVGKPLPTYHLVQLIDASIRGIAPDAIGRE